MKLIKQVRQVGINSIWLLTFGILASVFQGCISVQTHIKEERPNEVSSLQVMTFNIRLNTVNDGQDQWKNRRFAIKQFIEYADFDIFGIQEGLWDQVQFLDSLTAYQREGVGRDDGKTQGEFSAVYYRKTRFEKLSGGTFWLSETPDIPSKGWDAALNRVCSYVRLKERGTNKTFMVFNTHFDHIGNKAREESVGLIMRKAEAIAADDPVIIMGDFNLTPETKPMQLMKARYTDAFGAAMYKLPAPEGTFNAFKPASVYDRRIDYIFVNEAFKVNRYAVFTGTIDGSHYLSDHFPVWVQLGF